MRVTITFFLVAANLMLTFFIWTTAPEMEDHPVIRSYRNNEDIRRIMTSTDVGYLRHQAMSAKFDRETIEGYGMLTTTTMLAILLLLSLAALILLFAEIAARGRMFSKEKQYRQEHDG